MSTAQAVGVSNAKLTLLESLKRYSLLELSNDLPGRAISAIHDTQELRRALQAKIVLQALNDIQLEDLLDQKLNREIYKLVFDVIFGIGEENAVALTAALAKPFEGLYIDTEDIRKWLYSSGLHKDYIIPILRLPKRYSPEILHSTADLIQRFTGFAHSTESLKLKVFYMDTTWLRSAELQYKTGERLWQSKYAFASSDFIDTPKNFTELHEALAALSKPVKPERLKSWWGRLKRKSEAGL